MPILRRSCFGSAPIPTLGSKLSPTSDPDSVSPPGWFPVYAILQIASAGGGSKAPPLLAPRSRPRRRNWPDAVRVQQRNPLQIWIDLLLALAPSALLLRCPPHPPVKALPG